MEERSWEAALAPHTAPEQHTRGYAANFAAKRGLGPLHAALNKGKPASCRTLQRFLPSESGASASSDGQRANETPWPPLEDPGLPVSQRGSYARGYMASHSQVTPAGGRAATAGPPPFMHSVAPLAGAAREVDASEEIGAMPAGSEAGDATVSLIAMADGVLAAVDASGRSDGAAADTPWSLLDGLSRESAGEAPRPTDSENTASLERVFQLVQATELATQKAAAAASAVRMLADPGVGEAGPAHRQGEPVGRGEPRDMGHGAHHPVQAETPGSSAPPSQGAYYGTELGEGAGHLLSRAEVDDGQRGGQPQRMGSRLHQGPPAALSPVRRQGLRAELARLQTAAADLEEERRRQDEEMARLEATYPLSIPSADANGLGDAHSLVSSSAAESMSAPPLVPASIRHPGSGTFSAMQASWVAGAGALSHAPASPSTRRSPADGAASAGERVTPEAVPALPLDTERMGPPQPSYGPLNPDSTMRLREETRRIRQGAGLCGIPLHLLPRECHDIVKSLRRNGRAWRTLFQHYAAGSAEAQYIPTHRSRGHSLLHPTSRRTLPADLTGRRRTRPSGKGSMPIGSAAAQRIHQMRQPVRQHGLADRRAQVTPNVGAAEGRWAQRGGRAVGELRAFARTMSRRIEDEDEARFGGSATPGIEVRRRTGATHHRVETEPGTEQREGLQDAFWAIEARLGLEDARRKRGQELRREGGAGVEVAAEPKPPRKQGGGSSSNESGSSESQSRGPTFGESGPEEGAGSEGESCGKAVHSGGEGGREEGPGGRRDAAGPALCVGDLQATARSGSLRREGPSSTRRLAFAQLLRFARQFEVVPNLCTRVRLFQLFGAAQGAEGEVRACPASPSPSLAAVRELGAYSSELMAGQQGGLTFGEFEVLLAFLTREAFGTGGADGGAGPARSLVAWMQGAQAWRRSASERSSVLVQFRTGP